MPTYTFCCQKCKDSPYEEIVKSITDDTVPLCKICHREMVHVIQPSTFILKGGAWANEGYSRGRK